MKLLFLTAGLLLVISAANAVPTETFQETMPDILLDADTLLDADEANEDNSSMLFNLFNDNCNYVEFAAIEEDGEPSAHFLDEINKYKLKLQSQKSHQRITRQTTASKLTTNSSCINNTTFTFSCQPWRYHCTADIHKQSVAGMFDNSLCRSYLSCDVHDW